MLAEAIRARGSFDRLDHDLAARHALRPTSDLVAELRHYADSRRLPAPTNHRNTLVDVLVHGQDVAVPLDIDHPMALAPAPTAADRVWRTGWPFWSRRRVRNIRLVATDVDWVAGQGAALRRPITQRLLLMTGRPLGVLARLSCPGLGAVRQVRTAPHSPYGAT